MDHKSFWENINKYDDQLFSIFADIDAENPIFDYLNNKQSNLVVADMGCGSGNLLSFLADRFQSVIALDYSKSLLHIAKSQNKNRNNIDYIEANMLNLSELHNSIDLLITANSLLPENISSLNKMLKEMFACLTPNGEIIGILPSADVVTHLALLQYEDQMGRGVDENTFEQNFINIHKTSLLGFHRDSPDDPVQKYWYPFEITWRFEQAGFHSVTLKKVYYSWDYCKNKHYGYYPNKERIWDWFVTAKK